MPAKQRPTSKSPSAKPRPRSAPHALSSYQSVLDFVNAKLDESNYLTLLGAGILSAKVLEVNFTLLGKREITRGAAAALQGRVRLALECFLRGEEVAFEKTFKVAGRELFGLVEGQAVNRHVGEDGVNLAGNDLQDFWYLRTADLIRTHGQYADLKTRRESGSTDGFPPAEIILPGPNWLRLLSFRPLARCAAPACSRFYFQRRLTDLTCGKKTCKDAHHYKRHKSELRPTQQPRHKLTIPPPRAKRGRT